MSIEQLNYSLKSKLNYYWLLLGLLKKNPNAVLSGELLHLGAATVHFLVWLSKLVIFYSTTVVNYTLELLLYILSDVFIYFTFLKKACDQFKKCDTVL